MSAFWIILIAAAVVIALILCARITFDIKFEKNELNKEAQVWIKYSFFKKRIYPVKVRRNKKEEKIEESAKSDGGQGYIDNIKRAAKAFDLLKDDAAELLRFCTEKMIKIKEVEFDYKFGLDDPMYTGIANGLVYGTVYNVLGLVHNNARIEECRINISPDFERVCHNISFHCILQLKNVHIIVMIVKVVRMYSKFKKSVKA